MWNLILTPQQYSQTLQELLELEFWYANKRALKEEKTFEDAINQYTEIYYYSTEYKPDVPAAKNENWQKIVMELSNKEDELWSSIKDYITPRIQDDLKRSQTEIKNSYFGFMYEFCPEYESDSNEDFLTIHFRNYFAPDSPFVHACKLKEGLRQVVEKAMFERPDITQVQCASWLNNRPEFTGLFPEQWLKRSNFCYPMTASTGWWGRFIDRKGLLNQKAADELKSEMRFTMPNRHCRCLIEELHDFVK